LKESNEIREGEFEEKRGKWTKSTEMRKARDGRQKGEKKKGGREKSD
jgi:hypothetical protein